MSDPKTITPQDLKVPLEFAMPRKADWRIGIVGFGGIARQHFKSYAAVGWTVAAVADTAEAARVRAKEEFGIAKAYEDFRDLIADPEIDVIDLCTQPDVREPVVQACCAASKPIITEKPLTESMAEGERMAEAVEAAGIKMAVHQNYRWMRANFLAHQIVAAGLIGRPYYTQLQIFQNQDNTIPADSWYGRCENFITLQWNNHLVDLLRYWTGRNPRRVWARTARSAGQHFASDMLLTSIYDFGEDLTGTIIHHELLPARQETSHRCRVDGQKGSIDFEFWGDEFRIASTDLGKETLRVDWAGWQVPPSWAGTMGDLLAAVETGREPTVSVRANLSTIRTVLAEHASAQAGGTWIELTD